MQAVGAHHDHEGDGGEEQAGLPGELRFLLGQASRSQEEDGPGRIGMSGTPATAGSASEAGRATRSPNRAGSVADSTPFACTPDIPRLSCYAACGRQRRWADWGMTDAPLPLDHGLFGRLRRDAGAMWEGYVAHDFVRALGRGTLPQAAFRHFLVQDYLFLIHFARAHALAGFKATQLADIRAAAAAVSAIVDVEMPLHISYCAGWGLSEAQMAGAPEAAPC